MSTNICCSMFVANTTKANVKTTARISIPISIALTARLVKAAGIKPE